MAVIDNSDVSDVYYDPYDFEIDADPYPMWRKMREQVPLYRNEKYDFWALSRFDDVEKGLIDWETYRSGRGSILELIRANVEIPSGAVLFEDPPEHDMHRALLSRVFTPKKMNAIEPKVREFCARTLDPMIEAGGFDFIRDFGAMIPMRTIGYLLGIPESDQEEIRDRLGDNLKLEEGDDQGIAKAYENKNPEEMGSLFADYIDWRAKHPSNDLMTELLNAEFEDEHGNTRKLRRPEVLTYVNLLAGAGNETTARLIGWTGKTLAEHPDQLRQVAQDRTLVPKVIEEVLRYESPSPVQARYVAADVEKYGQKIPEGSIMLLLNGSANRDSDQFPDGDKFDINRRAGHHLAFGYGLHFCLGAALARLEGRVALDEVLQRFPEWDVDYNNAIQARTSTVRGWESLPVFTKSR